MDLTCAFYCQVTSAEGAGLKRGTRITLFLKDDAKDLADDKKLGSLIKQYSEFIQFPIRLWQSSVKNEEVSNLPVLSIQKAKSFILKILCCSAHMRQV